MNRRIFAVAVVAVALGVSIGVSSGVVAPKAAFAADEKRELKWSFPARDASSLSLSVRAGSIKVTAEKRDKIEIRAVRLVRCKDRDLAKRVLERTSVKVELRDHRVTLDDIVETRRETDDVTVELDVEIKVPIGMSLRSAIGAGETQVSGEVGVVNIRCGAGKVTLEKQNLRRSGAVSIEMGDLFVEGIVNDFDAVVKNGSIVAEKLDASRGESVTFQVGNGNIRVGFKKAPKETLRAMTGTGNVVVKLPGSVQGSAVVAAGTGNVKSDFSLRRGSRPVGDIGGQLSGEIGSGRGVTVRAQSGVGDVLLEKD